MWVAREGLKAKLPEDWKARRVPAPGRPPGPRPGHPLPNRSARGSIRAAPPRPSHRIRLPRAALRDAGRRDVLLQLLNRRVELGPPVRRPLQGAAPPAHRSTPLYAFIPCSALRAPADGRRCLRRSARRRRLRRRRAISRALLRPPSRRAPSWSRSSSSAACPRRRPRRRLWLLLPQRQRLPSRLRLRPRLQPRPAACLRTWRRWRSRGRCFRP